MGRRTGIFGYKLIDGLHPKVSLAYKVMSKILIAEDDKNLSRVLRDALTDEQHTVEIAGDGSEALDKLTLYSYDVLILDWNLPLLTGIEVCRKFRAKGGITPIIMLTANSKLNDKSQGFQVGVDDYLTKPFELQELLMRVKALLRRPPVIHVDRWTAGKLVLESDTRKVTKAGREIDLKPREFALLEFLVRNSGTIYSAEELLKAVWSSDEEVGTETIRTHIKKLRAKLDDEGEPSIIVNVFAVGYKIDA